jgi:hypothetical protein
VPDLGRWRLELDAPPGGWLSEPNQNVRFKLVDPGDPAPPKDGPDAYDPYEDAERYRPPAPEPEPTPEQLRERARRAEAERKANLWRQRTVQLWLNGEASLCHVEVNATQIVPVQSQNGENRLELFEPDSGVRASCSWWVSTARTRLRVEALQDFRGWSPPGSLQVLEPDGSLAEPGRTTPSGGRLSWRDDYRHAAPRPGVYTVRWNPSAYGEPAVVTVVVLLDPGTDQERRWRLIRLILPGSPPTILGTFHVEP